MKPLDITRKEEILIQRRGEETFSLSCKNRLASPLDVPGLKTRATTADIIEAVRKSRERGRWSSHPRSAPSSDVNQALVGILTEDLVDARHPDPEGEDG